MTILLILGSSSLVATEERQPTHLAFLGRERGLLIDCGISPRGRLERLGIGRDAIDDVVITHFHPDHAAGLPQFFMELSLLGRKKPLSIFAGAKCLERIEKILAFYEWNRIPDFYPVDFRPIPNQEKALVLENRDFRVSASPVHHVVPTMGVRVECLESGKSVVFSADTEPSPSLTSLAKQADLLIHEATGEGTGHSSAAQAGEIARQAGAQRLLLIHYNPYGDVRALISAAQEVFHGPVEAASDRMEISI